MIGTCVAGKNVCSTGNERPRLIASGGFHTNRHETIDMSMSAIYRFLENEGLKPAMEGEDKICFQKGDDSFSIQYFPHCQGTILHTGISEPLETSEEQLFARYVVDEANRKVKMVKVYLITDRESRGEFLAACIELLHTDGGDVFSHFFYRSLELIDSALQQFIEGMDGLDSFVPSRSPFDVWFEENEAELDEEWAKSLMLTQTQAP